MSARQVQRMRQRQTQREARRINRAKKLTVATGAALGGVVLLAPSAEAATFTVSNLNDAGDGSLRDALDDANANGGVDDVVVFASGLSGTITLTSGDLDIFDGGVEIQGPGAGVLTVSGNDLYRVFDVYDGPGEPVTISGLTIADGSASQGGAVSNEDTELTIVDSVVTGNEANNAAGIYNYQGDLAIIRSSLTNNDAGNVGGAIFFYDSNSGAGGDDFVMRDSVVSGNTSGSRAAGVYVYHATNAVTVERTTFSGNEAGANAGGLLVGYLDDGTTTSIASSTFAGNTSENGGAGLWVRAPKDPVTVQDTTFSGNEALYGGAILAYNSYDQPVSVLNSTIVGNTATDPMGGGGIYQNGDDNGGFPGTDSVTLSSTIVSGNTASGGGGTDLEGGGDGPAAFNVGFSLIGSTSIANGATLNESPAGSNLLGVDPQLGPLASNGGPTQTHLPAVTSPAIDAGIANGLTTDQRGVQRTFDAANVANRPGSDGTDIGAVELLPGNRLSLAQCKGQTETVLFAPGTEITGTDANDVIVGTAANDSIDSGRGKDTVCGAEGNDGVKAGAGKDNVAGQAGKDRIKGNGGNDKLQGNAGRDTLKGGGGKDTLKGGGGKDKLRGGPGKDKLRGGAGKDSEIQ